jgi:hypothetical protein
LSLTRRFFLGALGFVFGSTQIVVPVLAGRAGIRAVLAIAATVLVFAFIGRALGRLSGVAGRVSLACGFVLLTTLSIAEPYAFQPFESSLWGIVPSALTGLFFSCAMHGWYLLVSLAFDGHFNEAGGAARIAEFKQIVRLCIRKDAAKGSILQAYVIAIDEPADTRAAIRGKLIDYFELCPRV